MTSSGSSRPPWTADLADLERAWREAGDRPLLVVTGAGISRASGIQTYRGSEPDAVWKVSDIELATADYFAQDPVGQWRWYLDRFRRMEEAEPNAGHHALAALETLHEKRGGRLTLLTQNIDTLHERAGSRRLLKIHGTSARVRCSRRGCDNGAPRGSLPLSEAGLEAFCAEPSRATLPTCPLCSAPLRAHVLFFDEYYQDHEDYRFDSALRAADEAGLVIFAGTSFSVGITDLIGRAAALNRAPAFSVDPNPAPQAAAYPIAAVVEPAERLLPDLVAVLGGAAK